MRFLCCLPLINSINTNPVEKKYLHLIEIIFNVFFALPQKREKIKSVTEIIGFWLFLKGDNYLGFSLNEG